MKNMASVIQNCNTNLLNDPVAPTAMECSVNKNLIAHELKNSHQNVKYIMRRSICQL